ncbi:MAG: hypothetical protein IKB73_04270 [Ruminococcus sp.]|nr:hypothetical protein [Ruminococcus sp.]
MSAKYTKNALIPLSLCDNTGKLSVYSIFTLFMDIATEHADILKLDSDHLGENLFWVTVRTKVKVIRRPKLSSEVTLSTWPEKPSRVRANRHYLISDENGAMIKGKSEWTVVNTETGKLSRVGEIYGEDFEFCEDIACEGNYAKVKDDFSDAQVLSQYTINSTDIDLVQHMNNAAYIRAFLGAFSTEDLEKSEIKEIDIAYKAQSYEGETLTIKYKCEEDAVIYAMVKPDGTTAATLRVVR